jgi:hypothetical protein
MTKNNELFSVTEHGELWFLADIYSGDPICVYKTKSEPLWSLAYNEERGFLAVGERFGRILIFDAMNGFTLLADTDSRLPKRMKWITKDRLLVGRSGVIDDIRFNDGEWHHEENFFQVNTNTVEDFISIDNDRILACITYDRYVHLCHMSTGELLSRTYWGSDYMKGLIKNDEKTFMVYGRDHKVKTYALADNHAVMMRSEIVC